MFKLGESYTRREIHDQLGGGLDDYLPHTDGEVVCGCFTRDANPAAPDVVLAGDGPQILRWARVFARQRRFVPVFMKEASNDWRYVGDFRVTYDTDDPQVTERFGQRADRSVSLVLFLEQKRSS